MSYYVYILSNKRNNVLYIGVTNNVERRVGEHKSGLIDGFSKKYRTHKVVYAEEYSQVEDALAREKQLKGWTRAKKEALIDTLNPSRRDLAEE